MPEGNVCRRMRRITGAGEAAMPILRMNSRLPQRGINSEIISDVKAGQILDKTFLCLSQQHRHLIKSNDDYEGLMLLIWLKFGKDKL